MQSIFPRWKGYYAVWRHITIAKRIVLLFLPHSQPDQNIRHSLQRFCKPSAQLYFGSNFIIGNWKHVLICPRNSLEKPSNLMRRFPRWRILQQKGFFIVFGSSFITRNSKQLKQNMSILYDYTLSQGFSLLWNMLHFYFEKPFVIDMRPFCHWKATAAFLNSKGHYWIKWRKCLLNASHS